MNESGKKKKGFSTAYGGKSEIHDTNRTVSDYSDEEGSLTQSRYPRGRDRSSPDEFGYSSKTSEYTYNSSRGRTQGTYSDPLGKTETASGNLFRKMGNSGNETRQLNLMLITLAFIIFVACALFFNRAFSEKSKDNPDAMLQSTTEPAVQAQPTPSTTKPHPTTTEPFVETQALPNVTETVHQSQETDIPQNWETDSLNGELSIDLAPQGGAAESEIVVVDQSQYSIDIRLTASVPLADFRVVALNAKDGPEGMTYWVDSEIYRQAVLDPETPLILRLELPEIVFRVGVIYRDSTGEDRMYGIGDSGLDGSLLLVEL